MGLAAERCVPCRKGEERLKNKEVLALMAELPEWQTLELERKIARTFKCRNFAGALALVNRIAALAELEGHHPDISFGWGYVEIILTTHAADGLTRNDFIVATKIDALAGN